MKIGTILHHKYFNGVAEKDLAVKYKEKALEYFKNFGMFATGIPKMITTSLGDVDSYNWNNVDKIIDFGLENDVDIHFNTVFTGRLEFFPDSFQHLSADEKYKALERHVKLIVSRYSGKVSFFKLVNELVLDEDNNFLGTGRKKIDLIADVFKWATDVYPNGKYMFNQHFSFDISDVRVVKVLEQVNTLTALGARIDLFGLQGHVGYQKPFFALPHNDNIVKLLSFIYNTIQIPISITEFDLSYRNHVSTPYTGSEINPEDTFDYNGNEYRNWYDYQAYAYENIVQICDKLFFMDSLYFWMFVDDDTLVNDRVGCGLLDSHFEPKQYMVPFLKRIKSGKM